MTEEDFFLSLVRGLARDAQVRVAFVCELVDNERERARTIALSVDGQFLENMEYKLSGTPCGLVYENKVLYHPSDVAQIYPEDRMLAEWKVDAYMGMAIFDSHGKPIGHLGIMSDQRIEDDAGAQTMLRKLATQVGAEMERRSLES